MVLADSTGVSPAPAYSGYYYLHLLFAYKAFTLYGLSFQTNSALINGLIS